MTSPSENTGAARRRGVDPLAHGVRGALEMLTIEALVFHLDETVAVQNRACRERRGDLLGRPLVDLCLDPALVQAWSAQLRGAVAGGHVTGEQAIGAPGDGRRWLEVDASAMRHEGDTVGLLVLMRDVTDCRRDRVALAQYADVFENMQIAVHVYHLEDEADDRSLRLVEVNPAAVAQIGLPREELLGQRIDACFPRLRTLGLPQAYAAVARSGRAARLGVVDYQDERIARATFAVRAFPLPDLRVGVALEDVSDHDRRARARQRSHKLESLGVMAGGLAHDLNNVLTVILGNLSLARERSGSAETVAASLADAEQAVSRAQHLTRQLLTLSGTRRPIRESVQIADLLGEAAALAFSGSEVRWELDLGDDLWLVRADVGQISQALHNVLRNALDAMEGRGTVRISARNRAVRGEDALPVAPGDFVEIAIADDGPGISPTDLPFVFDPYFTTHEMGRGLGLAIAHSLVHGHGGHITAGSAPGSGACFVILLPVGSRQPLPLLTPPGRALRPVLRVLVMDDDPLVRGLAVRILDSDGYRPTAVAHGQEAVERVREAEASGEPFDAVILDLTVPGGMGGKRAVQLIREITPDVRAVVSSGYSADPVLTAYREHGFDAAVSKPYRVTELREALLGGPTASPEGP